jgi:hypothetical protein
MSGACIGVPPFGSDVTRSVVDRPAGTVERLVELDPFGEGEQPVVRHAGRGRFGRCTGWGLT